VIRHVQTGKTLDCPPGCPDAVYQMMLACWRRQPHERATMKHLRQCLDLFDEEASSPVIITAARPDKLTVAIDDASSQNPQSLDIPYLEIVP